MFRKLRFFAYWPLLIAVDAMSKIGYTLHPSELRRLYSENIALKAVNEVLRGELHRKHGKRAPVPIKVRAAQVFAYLITRGNLLFQKRFLGAEKATIKKWAWRFRHPFSQRKPRGGRPPIDQKIVEWVLKLKRENPKFGGPKISKMLGRMPWDFSEFLKRESLRVRGAGSQGDSENVAAGKKRIRHRFSGD